LWWDDSDTLATVVEQQLSHSHARVRMLEKRVQALEAKLGMGGDADEAEATSRAY
jgi:hypothetical protein